MRVVPPVWFFPALAVSPVLAFRSTMRVSRKLSIQFRVPHGESCGEYEPIISRRSL